MMNKLAGLPDDVSVIADHKFLEKHMPLGKVIYTACNYLHDGSSMNDILLRYLASTRNNSMRLCANDWHIEKLVVRSLDDISNELQERENSTFADSVKFRNHFCKQMGIPTSYLHGASHPTDIRNLEENLFLNGKDQYGNQYDRVWWLDSTFEGRKKQYDSRDAALNAAVLASALEDGSEEVYVYCDGKSMSKMSSNEYKRALMKGKVLHASYDSLLQVVL